MGTPQKDSFANRVRKAVKALAAKGEACTTDAISVQALISTREDHKRMLGALCDLVKGGELVRIKPGCYLLTDRDARPDLCQVMWRILRMRRLVSIEDLMEMSGVSSSYAAEWLRTLTRHGVTRQEGDSFRLLKDTVEMPEMTDNADKLRALRDKKKDAVLIALQVADRAINQAREALNDL